LAKDDVLKHLFATEGGTGISVWGALTRRDEIGDVLVQPPHGRYRFAESPLLGEAKKGESGYRRFVRDPARATGSAVAYSASGGTTTVPNQVVVDEVNGPSARYGFTWRGIVRPNDRELGISGAELLIVDTKTAEVLGVRRVFRVTAIGKTGAWWLTAGNCSNELAGLPTRFIYNVLKPID
jgi:hypothetical protein